MKSAQSTIYVIPKTEESDLDAAEERIGKIFRHRLLFPACVAEKDLAAIREAAGEYLRDELLDAATLQGGDQAL